MGIIIDKTVIKNLISELEKQKESKLKVYNKSKYQTKNETKQ